MPITVEMLLKGAERYPGTELLIARAQGKRVVAGASPNARVDAEGIAPHRTRGF